MQNLKHADHPFHVRVFLHPIIFICEAVKSGGSDTFKSKNIPFDRGIK